MRTRVHPAARPARLAAAGIIVVSTIVVGCAQLDSSKIWPWSIAKAEPPQPGRLTVAWTHATETEAGRPMRGFRGRIFFYPTDKKTGHAKLAENESDKPMKVEGTLTVYAFQMMADGKLNPAAPRKFLFEPENFKKQGSESKLGPSYQVWLPWDSVGGPPQQVSLWTRFDGVNQGAVVMSDHMPQLLPGVSQMSEVSKIAAGGKPGLRQSATADAPPRPVVQTGYNAVGPSSEPAPDNHSDTDAPAPGNADFWK